MAQIMEAEVVDVCLAQGGFPGPLQVDGLRLVPAVERTSSESMRRTLDSWTIRVSASPARGMERLVSFLVSDSRRQLFAKSTCFQRSPMISPRRMPVEMASTTTGYRNWLLDALHADSRRSRSSPDRKRSLPRAARGFVILRLDFHRPSPSP